MALFNEQIGSNNPFNGIDVGNFSAPTFADLDDDGDLDAIVGESSGTLKYYQNTGTANSPNYVEQTSSNNPFNGIDVGDFSTPTFADIGYERDVVANDGDLDVIVGERNGRLKYYQNMGSATTPRYVEPTGGLNPSSIHPFERIDVGNLSAPTFADTDGVDALVGENDGTLRYYQNTNGNVPSYVERAGSANPFSSIDVEVNSKPTFADVDNDGDLDVIVGEYSGTLRYYQRNTDNFNRTSYVEQTGSNNPLNSINVGSQSAPAFADIDGDGDLDAIVGEYNGTLRYFRNDTSPPSLAVGDVMVNEADGTATFTVVLDAASNREITINFATVDGTATAGSDYTSNSGTLTYAIGDTTKTITVNLNEDTINEVDETFTFSLSDATNAVISDGNATATITDNDALPRLSIDDATVDEDDGTATFTVRLDAASGQEVTVDFATADGTATAGSEYEPTNGTLTFDPGETEQTISVNVQKDNVYEPTQNFFVALDNAVNGEIEPSQNQGDGVILNDDPLPKLSVAEAEVAIKEGDRGRSTAKFVLTLKGRTEFETVVDYRTVDGEAKAGSDYTKTAGQVTLRPGQAKKTIRVPIIGDTQVEADETFKLEIAGASSAQVVKNTTTVTIRNDDDRSPRGSVQRANSMTEEQIAIVSEPDQLTAPGAMKVFEPTSLESSFETGSAWLAQLGSSALDNSSLLGIGPLLSTALEPRHSELITVSEALI